MLHLLKGSREELAKYIKEQNKKIVVYGAGMIGKVNYSGLSSTI